MLDFRNRRIALALNSIEELSKLVDARVPFLPDTDTAVPLVHAAVQGASIEAVELLLKLPGATEMVNLPNMLGDFPVSYAADRGDLRLVALLVQAGADLNAQNFRDNETPLTRVIEQAPMIFIKGLVELGADVNLRGYNNLTAIQFAERRASANPNSENLELLRFLKRVAYGN